MAARLDSVAGARPVEPLAQADIGHCPLCDGPNQCALAGADPDSPCWCVGHRFDDRLFARIRPEDLGRRCVCARCAFAPIEPVAADQPRRRR